MTFTLGDDGTLDTVLTCDKCGNGERYNFDGCTVHDHIEHPVDCNCYTQFVTWAKDDVKNWHECDFS